MGAMRRKGKPRAKTRASEGATSSSREQFKCDTREQQPGQPLDSEVRLGRGAQPEVRLIPNKQQQQQHSINHNDNPPLISISMAPATSSGGQTRTDLEHNSAATSCASSSYSLRSQVAIDLNDEVASECATTKSNCGTHPTSLIACNWRSSESKTSDTGEARGDGDADSMRPLNRANSSNSATSSCHPFDFSNNNSSTAVNADQPETCPANGLASVQLSFIALVNCNKRLHFYLGTLLFALVATLKLLKVIISSATSEDELNGLMTPTRNNSSNTTLDDCDQQEKLHEALWCALFALVPLALILFGLVTIKLLKFESTKTTSNADKRIKWTLSLAYCREMSALLTSILILILPIGFLLFNYKKQSNACAGRDIRLVPLVGLTALSALAHTLPLILSEISPPFREAQKLRLASKRLVRSMLFVIVILGVGCWVLWFLDDQEAEEETNLEEDLDRWHWTSGLIVLIAALLCGQAKRAHLFKLTSAGVFKGANELIEAKVSLEQQRQQQETLLLSVLPAYVAEQVKRTMVKKMESQEELPPPPVGATDGPHQMLLVSTSNASTQTFGSPQVRSLTLPSDQPLAASQQQPRNHMPPELPPEVLAEIRKQEPDSSKAQLSPLAAARQQRHSFAKFARLSTSLASGAAYLSETLSIPARRNSSARQLVSTSTQAVPKLNSRAPIAHQNSNGPTTAPPTANFNAIPLGSPATAIASAAASVANSARRPQLPVVVPPQIQVPAAIQVAASTSLQQQQSRRGFNELYIRTYNNVSLLYGDIVGFTSLCTQLSSSQLVRVLNNLFSHFDHLADQHKIMRIKILGDCYYGVSGIPEFAVMGAKSCAQQNKKKALACGQRQKINGGQQENHAINCVNMGLDMIEYIKCLQIEREPAAPVSDQAQVAPLPSHFELNMRIGIHTGHIHSGVIGLKKWQFDVWSNDVSIAMHCESSGVAGRVQVTEATISHLHDAFSFEPAPSTSGPLLARDSFLTDQQIRTFLIRERVQPQAIDESSNRLDDEHGQKRQLKAHSCGAKLDRKWTSRKKLHERDDQQQQQHMDEDRIRAATIGTIGQTLLSGEISGVTTMPASLDLACDHADLERISLTFKDAHLELHYLDHSSLSLWKLICEHLYLILLLIALPLILSHLVRHDRDFSTAQARLATLSAFALLLLTLQLGRLLMLSKSTDGAHAAPTSSTANNKNKNRQFNKSPSLSIGDEILDRKSSAAKRSFCSHFTSCDKFVTKHCDSGGGGGGEKALLACRKWRERRVTRRTIHVGAGLCLSSLVFVIVILGHSYQQLERACQLTSQQGDESIWWRQTITLLLLMAIDLSAGLLQYKLKCLLLGLIALNQLMMLLLKPLGSTAAMHHPISDFICGKLNAMLINEASNNHESGVTAAHYALIGWLCDALLLVLALWSLGYARKLEFAHRCNFLWRNRLSVDHEELEYISGINKVLLENILPSHVVQHYLSASCTNQQRVSSPLPETPSGETAGRMLRLSMATPSGGGSQWEQRELYHEQHDSVAVMFASIPHFYDFYDETDINKQGLGCIALLNEIICDFDKLLLKNKFSRIEKIKTIGSTYMAASGLRPSGGSHTTLSARNSTSSQASHLTSASPISCGWQKAVGASGLYSSGRQLTVSLSQLQQQQKTNLICMIQFATSLMTALNGINKQSFQTFKLRVGVNTGPVIAGIIGAQRPFYDIWGDCVNIASRMESLGEVGRIQVEERTAGLLLECLCTETYSIVKRGHINVKGKGGMVTYFVDKKQAGPASQAASAATSVQHQTSLQAQPQRRLVASLRGDSPPPSSPPPPLLPLPHAQQVASSAP